jgi:hypothetical protein
MSHKRVLANECPTLLFSRFETRTQRVGALANGRRQTATAIGGQCALA